MGLREFADLDYLPMLAVRPGEMRALEELPERTKDVMLPFVPLRPWVSANRLHSALSRIESAYSDRPLVVGIGEREPHQDRPVFDELERLRDPGGGFLEWCNFIEDHENFIPVLQLDPNVENETLQAGVLWLLGRGLVIHIKRPLFGGLLPLCQRIGAVTDGGADVLFVLDFETVRPDHLQVGLLTQGYIETLRQGCPNCYVSVSATSFPPQFDDGHNAQPIYERRLFDVLVGAGIVNLVYSDRGSARIDRLGGGGGQPYPRIDYPLARDWLFFRHEDQNGFEGYRAEAVLLENDPRFNSEMRVWGTQMIERTAAGDRSAISNPQKATAARINLHLQVQSFYSDPNLAMDTEDDWED